MLGKKLRGRYQIIRLLGSGGFGATFVAEDWDLPGKPQCVVKQLKSKEIDPSILQTARRLFETEAQVLYRLGKHDRIPQLLAHFDENQEFYLVQEFIEGEDLSQQISAGKKLNEAEIISFLQDVLETLEFVHQQNVIHRDIKPSNLIRRRQDDKFVLIDFGAVKEITTLVGSYEGQSRCTILIGSSGYMPNEQLGGKPRFSSDIFALGMTAIEALTGFAPEELEENPENGEIKWRDLAPVSDRLASILDKMVRSHFKERYQTAREVLTDLEELEIATTTSTKLFFLSRVKQKVSFKHSYLWLIMAIATLSFCIYKILQTTIAESQLSIAVVNPTPSPHIPEALDLFDRGKTLIELRRYDEALSNLEKAVQLEPTYTEVWLERGKAFEELQKYEEALKSYEQALTVRSDYSEAWYRRGLVLEQLKRNEEAIISLDNAIEIQPNYPEAYYQKGIILSKSSRGEEAMLIFKKVLELQPDYAEAWYQKALLLNKIKRDREALSDLEKALQVKPYYLEAWIKRGCILSKLDQFKEAMSSLDKALEIDPNSAEAWAERGNALIEQSRYDEALASLEKALQIKGDYVEAWYNKGVVLEKMEKYDEAIQSLDKATQIKPDYTEAWYRRGVILENLNKHEEAINAYNKAIESWPANRTAIENRKRLLTKLNK